MSNEKTGTCFDHGGVVTWDRQRYDDCPVCTSEAKLMDRIEDLESEIRDLEESIADLKVDGMNGEVK